MNVEELIPYENNPRHNEQAIDIVANSIIEFGFKVPIVVDKDNIIITGHTRVKAAKKLNMEEVPVIVATDLSEEKIKAFRIADNKTAEYATWDMEKLNEELDALKLIGFDMTKFDFQLPEADIEEDDFDFDEEVAEASKRETITKPGDIWKLGRHRLMCGDSTKRKDMQKLMKGYKAKLIITDPLYNVNYEGRDGMKIENDNMDNLKFRAFLTDSFKRMFENAALGAPIYVFHADSEGYNFRGAYRDAGFKLAQCLIWVKNALVLGRQDYHWRHEPILYGWREGAAHFWYGDRDKDTVIDEDKINFTKAKKGDLVDHIKDLQEKLYENSSIIYHDKPSLNAAHPTMKPVKLLGKLIHNSSGKGDLVLDSFGGSGSTMVACEKSGRTAYSMELDPVYCDVIVKRYEDLTGEPAELVKEE